MICPDHATIHCFVHCTKLSSVKLISQIAPRFLQNRATIFYERKHASSITKSCHNCSKSRHDFPKLPTSIFSHFSTIIIFSSIVEIFKTVHTRNVIKDVCYDLKGKDVSFSFEVWIPSVK